MKKKLDYIVTLYKNGYKIRRLKTIFGEDTNYYISLLKHFDVKLCGNKNCPNGRIQSRSNFGKDRSQVDGLKNNCIHCANKVSDNLT